MLAAGCVANLFTTVRSRITSLFASSYDLDTLVVVIVHMASYGRFAPGTRTAGATFDVFRGGGC